MREAAFELANRDLPEQISLKNQRVRFPVEAGEQIFARKLDRLHRREHPAVRAGRRRDELQASPTRRGLPRPGRIARADPRTPDAVRRDARVEQHVRQRGGLRGRIQTVHVE